MELVIRFVLAKSQFRILTVPDSTRLGLAFSALIDSISTTIEGVNQSVLSAKSTTPTTEGAPLVTLDSNFRMETASLDWSNLILSAEDSKVIDVLNVPKEPPSTSQAYAEFQGPIVLTLTLKPMFADNAFSP